MLKFFKDKTSKSDTDKGFKLRANVILRFNLLVIFLFTTLGIFIIGKAAIIMFVERDYWNEIKEKIAPQDVSIPAHRGNILADDGELIVSTLPSYKIHIDFVYINKDDPEDEEYTRLKRDTLWTTELKPLCARLHEIFPEKSAEKFEKDLSEGYRNKRRYHWLYERKISYMQYQRLLELPIMKEGRKYSGIIVDEEMQRKNILGNTGNGTFGVIREVELVDSAKNVKTVTEVNGLEKKYNDYLKGEPGRGTKTSLRGKIVTEVLEQPINGYDIQTTLNTRMMDICHTALERVLKEKELAAGWAILMETKTGDIKAIVNLSRVEKDKYVDTIANLKYNQTANHALSDLNEPGSIFKTVALTAILADGKLTTKDSVKAYSNRQCHFSGARKPITDGMYRNNGTGKYSMSDAMMYSSNISLIQFIRAAYEKNPEEYTNTLLRFGLTENYGLVSNEATPRITLPGSKSWNGFTLSSLSYGYAVEMTAINMVSFYNTVANGGRQMRPRLVKAVLNDGIVIKEFPTEVIDAQLFPKEVADTITGMLVKVVNGLSIEVVEKSRIGKRDGTGHNAYSEMMTIAGKTGTAEKYDGKTKLMSFCGFFPAEEPEYTLIVQTLYDKDIDTQGRSLGGGSTSALVFKEIAEKIMAERFAVPLEKEEGKEKAITPKIKKGNIEEAYYLLESIGALDSVPYIENGKEWGNITYRNNKPRSAEESSDYEKNPNIIIGMGAKEATYILQKYNHNVRLEGYGTVESYVTKNDTIILRLANN